MVKEHGKEAVQLQIMSAISKCSEALDIPLSPQKIQLMAFDVLETYTHDSVEDVIEALKKGRRGVYGTTYNKLNMIVVSGWMAQHLEEKAMARENELKEKKDPIEIDYAQVKREWEQQKLDNNKLKRDAGFEMFRAEYLNGRDGKEATKPTEPKEEGSKGI